MAENDETASGANPVSLKVVRGEIAYARDVCECGGNWCQACTMTRSRLRWGYAEEHEGNVMRAPQSTLLRAIRENARAATERDEQRSRADKAEAERDAARVALHAQGEIRLDIRGASELRLRVGTLLQLHWKTLTNAQLDAIQAICAEALEGK